MGFNRSINICPDPGKVFQQ